MAASLSVWNERLGEKKKSGPISRSYINIAVMGDIYHLYMFSFPFHTAAAASASPLKHKRCNIDVGPVLLTHMLKMMEDYHLHVLTGLNQLF